MRVSSLRRGAALRHPLDINSAVLANSDHETTRKPLPDWTESRRHQGRRGERMERWKCALPPASLADSAENGSHLVDADSNWRCSVHGSAVSFSLVSSSGRNVRRPCRVTNEWMNRVHVCETGVGSVGSSCSWMEGKISQSTWKHSSYNCRDRYFRKPLAHLQNSAIKRLAVALLLQWSAITADWTHRCKDYRITRWLW